MMVRLHKHLAACGVGSRRQCEILMSEGRVTVDGVPAREPGTQVDPDQQEIRYNGKAVQLETHVYIMLNKPPGYVCTSSDPQGRPRALDLIPSNLGRIYNVGRLDTDSEGLIILTNDGEFAHRLSHPRHEVLKTYEIWLKHPLSDETRKKWLSGIKIEDDDLKVLNIMPMTAGKSGYGYRIVLGEGKNRHLRRMAESSGSTVLRLLRVAIGHLSLGTLKRSCWRKLEKTELDMLLMQRSEIIGNSPKKKTFKHPRTVDRR